MCIRCRGNGNLISDCALRDVQARFEQFGLRTHLDKTRLIECGRFATASRRKRGQGEPETFDFLGFTHYCREKRNGRFGLGRNPAGKRRRRPLRALQQVLRRRMHRDLQETDAGWGRCPRAGCSAMGCRQATAVSGPSCTKCSGFECGCSAGGRSRTAADGSDWRGSADGCGRR